MRGEVLEAGDTILSEVESFQVGKEESSGVDDVYILRG
jgi:hypothetical protein